MHFEKIPKGFWTSISINPLNNFIFSPFFSRVYNLSEKDVYDPIFQNFLGLKNYEYAEGIIDLANRVEVNSETTNKDFHWRIYPYYVLYLFFQTFRTILPFEFLVFLVQNLSKFNYWKNSDSTLQKIGQTVGAVENKCRKPSCYPRTLLTSFLCMLNGYDCDIYIGILAPTNLLHSWCCVGNKIPYEGYCEHFLYQPLLVRKLNFKKSSIFI